VLFSVFFRCPPWKRLNSAIFRSFLHFFGLFCYFSVFFPLPPPLKIFLPTPLTLGQVKTFFTEAFHLVTNPELFLQKTFKPSTWSYVPLLSTSHAFDKAAPATNHPWIVNTASVTNAQQLFCLLRLIPFLQYRNWKRHFQRDEDKFNWKKQLLSTSYRQYSWARVKLVGT